MATNDGGSAFRLEHDWLWSNGKSLLDDFAGQALAGIHATCQLSDWPSAEWHASAAKCAYDSAAAMIAERDRRMGADCGTIAAPAASSGN